MTRIQDDTRAGKTRDSWHAQGTACITHQQTSDCRQQLLLKGGSEARTALLPDVGVDAGNLDDK